MRTCKLTAGNRNGEMQLLEMAQAIGLQQAIWKQTSRSWCNVISLQIFTTRQCSLQWACIASLWRPWYQQAWAVGLGCVHPIIWLPTPHLRHCQQTNPIRFTNHLFSTPDWVHGATAVTSYFWKIQQSCNRNTSNFQQPKWSALYNRMPPISLK